MTDWLIIKKETSNQIPLVLIPGWGFTGAVLATHPVFAGETLITSIGFTSPGMEAGLLDFLAQQQIDKVRIMGWSMGGNVGVDFTLQHPAMVASLSLVAVRQSWPAEDIDLTRQSLFEPTGAGLEKFYRKCFLGTKSDYKQLTPLLKSYIEYCDVDFFDTGLAYLAQHRMVDSLPLPVHIIQGENDIVCPLSQMVQFSSDTEVSVLTGGGHFLFSHPDFRVGGLKHD